MYEGISGGSEELLRSLELGLGVTVTLPPNWTLTKLLLVV